MTDNKELIPGMNDIINHIKKLEKENKELKEQIKSRESLCNHFEIMNKKNFDKIKKLKKLDTEAVDIISQLNQEKEELKEQVVKLQQKATAWDIHNSGDWEYVSQSWDKEQCLELIKCGECKAEDFTHHETFNEEEEEYDTDNEEHSHVCESPGCNNNASEDQWMCNQCKKSDDRLRK